MTVERQITTVFSMTETVWERHANPWSVWTRFATLPLLLLAIWSRIWIGKWSIALTVLCCLWLWLNPRIFPKPRSTDNWASKAVLGERVWLNRSQIPIPRHHQIMATILSLVAGLGLPFIIWGEIELAVFPTVLGLVLIYAGKMWFLDRMVWLYEDMKETTPEYRRWLY